MSTETSVRASQTDAGGRSRTRRRDRLRALGRAEMILLIRNRTAVFTSLLMPLGFVLLMRTSAGSATENSALGANSLVMTGGIGIVLILVIYVNLVAAFVTRREELVLKRLRTGEASDAEILAGTAMPSAALALAQCVLLILAGTLALDIDLPQQPVLLLLGLLLGTVTLTALAAATTAITRTTESAQITSMPLMMLTFFGSGLLIPLDVLPDTVATVCELLPVTPVMDLIRYGWLGESSGAEPLTALALAPAWTALSVLAVRRWFRWEPRS